MNENVNENESTTTIVVMDQEIECFELCDGVLCPVSMKNDPIVDQVRSIAELVLSTLPESAKTTPWLIGSMATDILGNPRDAKSHSDHHAFDMSPMWSESSALDPERKMMGLAWNVLSLCLLAPLSRLPYWFCVEGDHLHIDITPLEKPLFEALGVPNGCLLTMPSSCQWYPITDLALSAIPGSYIVQKPFLFFWPTVSLLGPQQLVPEMDVTSEAIFAKLLPNY